MKKQLLLLPLVQRAGITALVIAGLALILFFGMRAYHDYERFQRIGSGITNEVQTIRGWMIIPYIAQSYEVPEEMLFDALHIPGHENRDLSLRQLASKYDRHPNTIRHTVQRAIVDFYHPPQHQPPPPREGNIP